MSSSLSIFRVLKASFVSDLSSFARRQDVPVDALVPIDKDIDVVLFISHRWLSKSHPDPGNSQLRLLQDFLQCLENLASGDDGATFGDAAATHGNFQAALVMGNHFGEQRELHYSIVSGPSGRESILDRIGIWYDYSCLPQHSSLSERSAEETHIFRSSLALLSEFMDWVKVQTVILIDEGDESYFERGWCYLEAMISQSRDGLAPVLNESLKGKRVQILDPRQPWREDEHGRSNKRASTVQREILGSAVTCDKNKDFRDRLLTLIDHLPVFDHEGEPVIGSIVKDHAVLYNHAKETALQTGGFLYDRDIVSTRVPHLWWDNIRVKVGNSFDIAEHIRSSMSKTGLKMTDIKHDTVLVGLLLLQGWHFLSLSSEDKQRSLYVAFYKRIVERYLDKETASLVHKQPTGEQFEEWALTAI